MQKFYSFLSCLLVSQVILAQNTNSVNFTYVMGPGPGVVTFNNTSVFQNTDVKKAFWTFGDGSATQTGPTAGTSHHYAAHGTYQVCLKVFKYNSTGHDSTLLGSECKNVVLTNPEPRPDSCGSNFTNSVTAASPLGIRFVAHPWHNNGKKPVRVCWKFGDGRDTCIQYLTSYTGDYKVEHGYTHAGNYEVCVTIKYDGGCEKKKCNLVIVSNNNQPRLVLTPNPVHTELHAVFNSLYQQDVSIKIVNANGIIVRSYTRAANVGSNTWNFNDLGSLPTGIYTVTVQSSNQFATATFFKQ